MAYQYDTSVKLHQTDSAGLLFFSAQFDLAHDAYEAFMASCDLSFADIFAGQQFLLPIVHAEADYRAALKVGDKLTIALLADKISVHSFVLKYDFTRDGHSVGQVSTVHVCIDPESGSKIELPAILRTAIQSIA